VRLPLATTDASVATLQRIHDESCNAQRIGAVAGISLQPGVPTSDASGVVLPATVVLDRRGDEPATLTATQVGGSVLYGLSAQPGALPSTLASGQPHLEIPVVVRSTRCTGHVIGEVKKPYDFGVWLSLDGADDQWTKVQTSPEVQATLRAYLAQACGLG
jgi:sugar (pentulose or hexulose) kinase